MSRIYISVGSNIQRDENIRNALLAMQDVFSGLVLSAVYESKAVGFDGDDFYNLVVAADVEASVTDVRGVLRQIEDRQGRVRDEPRFSSRTIDLDLLLFDDLVMKQDDFELPRPEITENAFVLGPLAELAPEIRHPVSGKTFSELWAGFDKASQPLSKVELV